MQTSLRPAQVDDFDFCARLYFAGMDETIPQLQLDRAAHVADFRRRWDPAEVRIIMRDGADIGWLQSRVEEGALFLAQLFVDAPLQRRGIGTEVMNGLIAEAGRAHLPVALGVVKTNPAKRLYDRLGFRVTHDDKRKFYMRRDPAGPALR
jgi:GNAT superfamily N-acetyltransferase